MASNYYAYLYGSFKPDHIKEKNDTKYTSKEIKEVKEKWNKAVELLKASGVDLNRVPIVAGDK